MVEDQFEGMIGIFKNVADKHGKAISRLELNQKMNFCRWLTGMTYTHKKTPEQILNRFNECIKVIDNALKKERMKKK